MKYKSKRIGDLSAPELIMQCKGITPKICVITGWQLPESQEYLNIFEDQLIKLLVDQYLNVNIDELFHAMRKYGTITPDWGRAINLSLIRDALDNYLTYRAELSRIEEHKSISAPQKEEIPPEVDWTDTIERMKSGDISGSFAEMIPYSSIYDWAENKGIIAPTKSDKWRALFQARDIIMSEIATKKISMIATNDERRLFECLKTDTWTSDKITIASLSALSKKLIIKDFIMAEKIKE